MSILPQFIGHALQHAIAPPIGLVLKVSREDGSILLALGDPKGTAFDSVTSVLEHDGELFLGSLHLKFVPVIKLSDIPSPS